MKNLILDCKCGEHIEGDNDTIYWAGWRCRTLKRGKNKGKTIFMCQKCTDKYYEKNNKEFADIYPINEE